MSLVEKLIKVVAPAHCLVCLTEGESLCEACLESEIKHLSSACFACGNVSKNYSTCQKCRRKFPLKHVWVVTKYADWPKQIVHELKFSSRRDLAGPIAKMCRQTVPLLDGYLVTHLPTVPGRIRSRGFDQAKLIAKQFAKDFLPYYPLLARVEKVHQTGSTKKVRQRQIAGAFAPRSEYLIKGSRILLVDDVATTGSSLIEAAKTLKKAGAKEVSAVVLART